MAVAHSVISSNIVRDVIISILRDKLYYRGFDTTHTKSNNRIRIRSKSVSQFLEWIGQYGIAEQYAYKWKS